MSLRTWTRKANRPWMSSWIRPVSVSSSSEVQYVVLQNVATMTIKRRVSYTWWRFVWAWKQTLIELLLHFFPSGSQGMFEPYLKSFYIRSTDPTQIKVLKVVFNSSWLWFIWWLYVSKCNNVLFVFCSWKFSQIWPTRQTFPPSSGSFRWSQRAELKMLR